MSDATGNVAGSVTNANPAINSNPPIVTAAPQTQAPAPKPHIPVAKNVPDETTGNESANTGNAPAAVVAPQLDLTPIVHQLVPEVEIEDQKIDRIISNRLSRYRSAAWEDDISRNTMDDRPFENLPPISTRDESELVNNNMLPQALLGKRNIKNLAARDPYPIPSVDDREGYSPGLDGNYWLSGLADHLKLMQAARKHGVFVRSYFDFGCATGRVIRHFACQTNIPEIWGSDINARHVRWLSEFMPRQVKPIANHCVPTVPIEDNSVDLISAFSVFTHIDTFELCWLAELRRILSPKGIAYLTVHNEATWNRLSKEIDNPNNRLIQSITRIDPETPQKLQRPMPDTRTVYRFTPFGPYRAQVFHSNNYLHKVWGRYFDILEIKDCHHVRQTVVVLRKR